MLFTRIVVPLSAHISAASLTYGSSALGYFPLIGPSGVQRSRQKIGTLVSTSGLVLALLSTKTFPPKRGIILVRKLKSLYRTPRLIPVENTGVVRSNRISLSKWLITPSPFVSS